MPNLSTLYVSHNLGFHIPRERFSQLFGSLRSLQAFYMGNFEMESINKNTFANLTRLTRLYLYRNKLTDIPDGAFDSLHSLTVLVPSDNQIQTVRESSFSLNISEILLYVTVVFSGFRSNLFLPRLCSKTHTKNTLAVTFLIHP